MSEDEQSDLHSFASGSLTCTEDMFDSTSVTIRPHSLGEKLQNNIVVAN